MGGHENRRGLWGTTMGAWKGSEPQGAEEKPKAFLSTCQKSIAKKKGKNREN